MDVVDLFRFRRFLILQVFSTPGECSHWLRRLPSNLSEVFLQLSGELPRNVRRFWAEARLQGSKYSREKSHGGVSFPSQKFKKRPRKSNEKQRNSQGTPGKGTCPYLFHLLPYGLWLRRCVHRQEHKSGSCSFCFMHWHDAHSQSLSSIVTRMRLWHAIRLPN